MQTDELIIFITLILVGALFYIIHLQTQILSQTNNSGRSQHTHYAEPTYTNNQSSFSPVPAPNTQSISNENDTQGGTIETDEKILPSADSINKETTKIHDTKKQTSEITSWKSLSQSSWQYLKGKVPFTTKSNTCIEYENSALLNRTLKANLIKHSKLVVASLPAVKIYKLNLNQISSNQTSLIKKFEFGKSKTGSYFKSEKVIMILGATGSGKTTLINSMINYVFGVEHKDKFRFKLVTEDADGGGHQAYSQTSWITAYTIHHQNGFKVPYTLTIIDTPGFGDTGGIQRDEAITKQIHQFFTVPGKEGIDHIDAVGFVAQSSLPRLTFTQKYIFDQILSLFGKDIGDNIYLMLTFADGKVPQVLTGIKEAHMPYQEFFKFNNSVIFDDTTAEDEFATMFWKMGMGSFQKFFGHFSGIVSKSLTQTKSVLEERERIETQIEGLQFEIKRGLNKLEQLRKEVEVVEQHKADLARNKNFTYTIEEDSIVKHELSYNTYVTNCLICTFTCHHPCGIPDDGKKYKCSAMDGGGQSNAKCTVCTGKCSWEQHKNMGYYFTVERQEVTKTSDDLKRRYQDASGKVKSATQIIDEMVDELEAVQIKIIGITEVLRRSINKLNEIALKPNPLSTGEYIRILIESEKSAAEPGWQDRVNHLNQVKEKVDNLAKVAKQGFDPFEAYKQKIKEERETKEGVWSAVGSYLQKIEFW